MNIDRKTAYAPRTSALAGKISQLQDPCVGCTDCVGMCAALIETMLVPEVVLRRERAE